MGRREDNKREKRARLLEAATAAFESDGYDRASIEQIAKAADVARGTFYLYFPDKLSVLQAVIGPCLTDLRELVGKVDGAISEASDAAEVYEIYQLMGVAIALIGLNHRDAVLLTIREHRRPGEAGEFLRREEGEILEGFTRMSERARDRGWITVRDPRLTVRIIFGAVERLYFDVLMGDDLGDTEAVSEEVVRLFTASMGLVIPA